MRVNMRLQDFDGKTVLSLSNDNDNLPEVIQRRVPVPFDGCTRADINSPLVVDTWITDRQETYEIERYFDCNDGGPLAVYRRVT